MAWETPKTNWITGDAVGPSDFNRIEANTEAIRDIQRKYIKGFNIAVLTQGSTTFQINTGQCYVDVDGEYHPVELTTTFTKTLANWSLGSGNGSKTSIAPAPTAGEWWYVFLLYAPATGTVDIIIDNGPFGVNINETGYYKRLISTFQHHDSTSIRMIGSIDDKFYPGYDPGSTGLTSTILDNTIRCRRSSTGPFPVINSGPFWNGNSEYLVPSLNLEVFGTVEYDFNYTGGALVASVHGERYGVGNGYTNNIITSQALGPTVFTAYGQIQYREYISALGTNPNIGFRISTQAGASITSVFFLFYVNGFIWDRQDVS